MNLGEAPIGSQLTVARVGGERSFRRRLMELGLVPGTRVSVLGAAPLGGPLELLARGCSLSIRREEAREVVVRADAAPHLRDRAPTLELGPSLALATPTLGEQ